MFCTPGPSCCHQGVSHHKSAKSSRLHQKGEEGGEFEKSWKSTHSLFFIRWRRILKRQKDFLRRISENPMEYILSGTWEHPMMTLEKKSGWWVVLYLEFWKVSILRIRSASTWMAQIWRLWWRIQACVRVFEALRRGWGWQLALLRSLFCKNTCF